jgi:putative peptidoglycan lipid II flippase
MNSLVDISLSTQFGEGSISIISYASRVNSLIITVFLTPIIAVFYPEISKLIALKKQIDITKVINRNFIFSLYLILPSSIGLLILSESIIGLIYGRGIFTSQDIIKTSLVLSAYSLTLVTNVFTTILGNIFFANKDTRTPLFIGGCTLLINVFLSFLLSSTYGLVGLPIATTVSSILAVILYWRFAKKMNYFVESNDFFTELFKIVISSLIMGGVLLGSNSLFQTELGLISIPLGAIIYLVLTIIFKTKLINDLKIYNLK